MTRDPRLPEDRKESGMSKLYDVAEYGDRDISHWANWHDSELIDQAACGCQHRALMDDENVREAIAMNIIAPFRQALAKAASGIEAASAGETPKSGSTEGESATRQGGAPSA